MSLLQLKVGFNAVPGILHFGRLIVHAVSQLYGKKKRPPIWRAFFRGAAGSRTRVQTRKPAGFYMLISP